MLAILLNNNPQRVELLWLREPGTKLLMGVSGLAWLFLGFHAEMDLVKLNLASIPSPFFSGQCSLQRENYRKNYL